MRSVYSSTVVRVTMGSVKAGNVAQVLRTVTRVVAASRSGGGRRRERRRPRGDGLFADRERQAGGEEAHERGGHERDLVAAGPLVDPTGERRPERRAHLVGQEDPA